MVNKKHKRKHNSTQDSKRQPSKQEVEMFSLSNCAHDKFGNPVDWKLIKSLWSI